MLDELYNKLKEEENSLNDFIKRVSIEKDLAYDKFNLAKQKRDNQKEVVSELNWQKDKMLSKYNWIISLFGKVILLGFSIIILFILILTLHRLPSINITDSFKGFLLAFEIFGGSIASSLISYFLESIIKKSFLKKIKNSLEYKELEGKINEAKEQLDLDNKKVEKNQKCFIWQKGLYNQVIKKRDKKKELIQYVGSQMNPIENTLHLKRIK